MDFDDAVFGDSVGDFCMCAQRTSEMIFAGRRSEDTRYTRRSLFDRSRFYYNRIPIYLF